MASVASDIVENYAVKLYSEFEKITNKDSDPSMFSSILTIISEVLELFDNSIVEIRSLKTCLNSIENERDELITEIQRERECSRQKTENNIILQDEIDLLKLDPRTNIWESDNLKLIEEKSQIEKELINEKTK